MSSKNHKNSKKTSTKKMSVYSMVPTLFILERPSPSKYLNPSRAMNNRNISLLLSINIYIFFLLVLKILYLCYLMRKLLFL